MGIFGAPVLVICRERQQGGICRCVFWDSKSVEVLVEPRCMVVGVQNQYIYGGETGAYWITSVSGLNEKMDWIAVYDGLYGLVGENRPCKTKNVFKGILISLKLL